MPDTTFLNECNTIQCRAARKAVELLPESPEREEMLRAITARLYHLSAYSTLELVFDHDTDNPLDPEDGSGWKAVSFSKRHCNYEDPEETGDFVRDEDGRVGPSPELQAKLDAGTAFLLSYFEHGNCMWFRQGSRSNVPDMRWDGVQCAGILFCPDDWNPPADTTREAQVDLILEEYSDWCNGHCYGYSIKDEAGEETDSCYGFIGDKYIFDHLRGEHPELFDEDGNVKEEIQVCGDAKDIF